MDTMKLEELARRSGVSPRTVRYYVQRGLLPAPAFHGRDTTYTEEHLHRLRAIKTLQERFLPLDAIESDLEKRTPEEIRKLGEEIGKPGQRVEAVTAHPHRAPAPPLPREQKTREQKWVRVELLPGLELHLSERADAITRSLAEELRALVERRQNGGAK